MSLAAEIKRRFFGQDVQGVEDPTIWQLKSLSRRIDANSQQGVTASPMDAVVVPDKVVWAKEMAENLQANRDWKRSWRAFRKGQGGRPAPGRRPWTKFVKFIED